MTGVTWVEITFSRHECGNKENKCGGSFVFVGDIISMARSIRVTNYQSCWFYGVVCVPVVVEKLLVNIFHVSLMLALLNSLPVCSLKDYILSIKISLILHITNKIFVYCCCYVGVLS